jgi:hypothetical protein
MRNDMKKNHKDKRESKLTATEDIKWVLDKKNGIWMPERKGTHKQVNSPATVFKAWATPITLALTLLGLIIGFM